MLRLTIFTLFVITPAIAFAQHNAGGCALVEGQKLKFLLGDWKVTSKFRLSKEPEQWEETQAHSKITSLFEDCLLVERFEGRRKGTHSKEPGCTRMIAIHKSTNGSVVTLSTAC
jgi:hypothetical protein